MNGPQMMGIAVVVFLILNILFRSVLWREGSAFWSKQLDRPVDQRGGIWRWAYRIQIATLIIAAVVFFAWGTQI